MAKKNGFIKIGAVVLSLGVIGGTVMAASTYSTVAESVANITGRSTESVIAERQETGKTYGMIAKEEGKLEEFKQAHITIKKEQLNAQVSAGIISQERADEILAMLEENQANCDGTGTAQLGKQMNRGCGNNQGECLGGNQGNGLRNGQGRRQGRR